MTENEKGESRIERDSLGDYPVPADALYGIHTARAVANFPLSGKTVGAFPELISTLARIKLAACRVNASLGLLPAGLDEVIIQACEEIAGGQWASQFVVDIFQGGAGTSTNMNMNEVVSNRALQLLGRELGDYAAVDPIGHVNRCQSTNDCYASAVRLAVYRGNQKLVAELSLLVESLERKACEFGGVRKLGRTQLQDAVPMTVGVELGAFAATLCEDIRQLNEIPLLLLEINLGGTAIGSGVGANPEYRKRIVAAVAAELDLPVRSAENLYEASWDMGAFMLYSGLLKRLAAKLSKIANDLRLLASGPRGGFGELRLPERQAGSSLMPGKVNPVIPEALNQVAFRIFGLDTSITFAAEAGQLQLNAFEPLIYLSLHEAIELLGAAIAMLRKNCIDGLGVDVAQCSARLDASAAPATEAAETIGYARAAAIAQHMQRSSSTWSRAKKELDNQSR